ncbi:hypothetical protein RUESEDTHA_01217 [Ruegeria sp. THAF57]|uniref:hypothetical protein n=1 Tax=Ruegeria sp. THAF57 TaxID=2744555 RepID=UPI0015DF582A|nr:hypothetical protein [Ruegeria sp. THAF57]CAD0184338.1 hypothetical protein RUESEDTHA_01217 [Ruegeria sp. THAF57]
MVLEYDFDIVVVDPGDGGQETGADGNSQKPVLRAMFRDVKTADALRATSPKIRKIFQDAGFGLDATGSELLHGLYRPRDEAERERILRALFANIRDLGVQGEYCGEFDFWKFLRDVKTARPRNGQRRKVADWTPNPRYKSPATPQRRTVPARVGVALGLAVVIFVILKYLADSGSTP